MIRIPAKPRLFYGLITAVITVPYLIAATATVREQPEKYQWLEDVSSPRSLNWVKNENQRTITALKRNAHYDAFEADALKLLQSPDRLAWPELNGQDVYNFWQDSTHVQGILRRTSLPDYLTSKPHWQTLLDLDVLSAQEHQKWVMHTRTCLYPGDRLCMFALSAGGEDASTMREFDLKAGKFVDGGFVLARSKQEVAWLDKDTLLVARDWGTGTLTKSSYPFIVKLWKRGQPLAEAKEVYRGTVDDEGVAPATFEDASGHRIVLFMRYVDFFNTQMLAFTESGVKALNLPSKIEITGMVDGQLIVNLDQDWTPPTGGHIAAGSVIAVDADAILRDPEHPKVAIVFAPTSVEFVQEVETTRNHILVTTLDNVQGRAYDYTCTGSRWSRRSLDIPENQTVGIRTTDPQTDTFFLSTTGFLTPSSLLIGNAAQGSIKTAKSLPAQFDASHDVVDQLFAVSKDGAKIPYFVVRPTGMKYDGSNPTVLSAYGGFQVSITPNYAALTGKLWLERGGVYVLANIRGGGEFGPAWHEAGLKTHRQRIYGDFAAVAQDLFARRITSPRRLGIMGGSNGGLLMGVEMTQRPDMWHAVAILNPLLDMLRFEKIAAGASWVAEYGTVNVPQEREFLATISPYNQLNRDTNYPEPFLFTTTKDDRVGPAHARKFAARMEEFGKPFYYLEIKEGGHGSGADLKEQAQSDALLWTYFTMKLMD